MTKSAYIIIKLTTSHELDDSVNKDVVLNSVIESTTQKLEKVIYSALDLQDDMIFGTQILHYGQELGTLNDLIMIGKLNNFTNDWNI